MGLLQNGKWVDQWYETKAAKGRFVRKEFSFRNWITPDAAPGPSSDGGAQYTVSGSESECGMVLRCRPGNPWRLRRRLGRC